MRVTMMTRRVTRLSLARDEYSFSRSRISSLASVCPHRARASFASVRSIHARDHRAVRAIEALNSLARDARETVRRRRRRGTAMGVLCSSFGDSRARVFAGARLGRACCDDRRHNYRIVAATTDRPLGSSIRRDARERARGGRRGGCANERTDGRTDERRRMDDDRITLNNSWTRNRRRD